MLDILVIQEKHIRTAVNSGVAIAINYFRAGLGQWYKGMSRKSTKNIREQGVILPITLN